MEIDKELVESGISIFKQVGFPAATAFWFMFRLERRLEDLAKAVGELNKRREEDHR